MTAEEVYADPPVRPSLDAAVAALTFADSRWPWTLSTGEEMDVAEALRHVAATHQGGDVCDNPEAWHWDRTWGTCCECDELWPCAAWSNAQVLAVEFLGRAHNRRGEHARDALRRLGQHSRGEST